MKLQLGTGIEAFVTALIELWMKIRESQADDVRAEWDRMVLSDVKRVRKMLGWDEEPPNG